MHLRPLMLGSSLQNCAEAYLSFCSWPGLPSKSLLAIAELAFDWPSMQTRMYAERCVPVVRAVAYDRKRKPS